MFQIIRHIEISAVVFPALFQIKLFPPGDIFVLRMVEQEIFHAEALRQLAGVFYRGVMFLIGFENVRLTIETESLVKKPGAVFGIALIASL